MIIIGCDYHPGFQQIAFVDTDSGEWNERKLGHREEAEQFYRQLKVRGKKVRVGMEASGHARWFERLLTELQFELWIGDAAEIRTKRVRKQKTDCQDAELLLRLLIEDRFPRIWVADEENRDLRQLLWHRHRLVQMRTRIMNQLHVLALNEGVRRKKALWRPAGRAQLQSLVLARWASRRRQDLLELLDAFELVIGTRTLWLRQADRQLCGAGAVGGVQRGSATAGPHQQTGQLSAAFSAGGSSSGDGPHGPRLAAPVSPPGHATRETDRQGSHGAETRGSTLLDVAEAMGLRADEEVRFARGRARKSPGCVVDHRRNDWASHSLHGEFELVIMSAVVIEEMVGSD